MLCLIRTLLLVLVATAGARAQHANCDLATLQSHLAGVQDECCFDDSVSDLQESLIAYWNFEEGPGHHSAEDVTGNGHDANWRGGRTGADKWPGSHLAGGSYAQDFQGTGEDTLRVNNKADFPTGDRDRTFMVWFKKNQRGDMAFFQHGCWRGCQGWNWGMRDDGQWMHLDANSCDCEFGRVHGGDCNSVRDFNEIRSPNDNQWHQAVISYARNGNRYKAWYDGQPFSEHADGGHLSTCDTSDGEYRITIGSHSWDENSWEFRGQMDEVAFWDTILTDEQVARLFNDGQGLDLSGGGNHGRAECTSGYPAAEDTCSRECARVIQPFWEDCGALLDAMHIGGTEGMTEFDAKCAARPTCDFSLLFEHMQTMDEICCAERGSCAAGNPGASDECSMECALVFEPFWDDCGAMMIAAMGAMMGGMDGMTTFYDTCLTTRYPPGSCTDQCNAQTLHCRQMEIQNACCGDAGNCPDVSVTPLECPVGCALFFPSLVADCEENLQASLSDQDMAEYHMFSESVYAEELLRQGCDIDLVPETPMPPPPPPPPPPSCSVLQTAIAGRCSNDCSTCDLEAVRTILGGCVDNTGLAASDNVCPDSSVASSVVTNAPGIPTQDGIEEKTGMAKLLQTNPDTCSWDSFDDRVIEVSATCCEGNADETCRDGAPPDMCSPVCAVVFHAFFEQCGTLLATVMAEQIGQYAAFDATCLASADVGFFLSAIQHTTCCISTCKKQLERDPGSTSGVYTMCGRDGADDYDVYCDMETDGGGWTMVMNINPVDNNLVGYGQDFWTGEHEYGEWEHHFANDYKSPAAYQLTGPDRYNADVRTADDGEILIQSVAYPDRETDAAFEDANIRGWRKWPMLPDYPSFQSMFSTECCRDDNCGSGLHPCKTGSPSGQEVGSTDEWDDIIRRGSCLRTDLRYGWTSGGEAFRMMTYDPVDSDDRMGGFGGATNCGSTLCSSQGIFGQRDNAGMDRVLCNQDGQRACGHGESRVMRNPVTGASEPCQQSPYENYCRNDCPYYYCDPNTFRPGWTSRFFVREPTALTPQMIAAMDACDAAGRFWVDGECVDRADFVLFRWTMDWEGWCDQDWDSATVGQENGQGHYMNLAQFSASDLRGRDAWLINLMSGEETQHFRFAGADWERVNCARRIQVDTDVGTQWLNINGGNGCAGICVCNGNFDGGYGRFNCDGDSGQADGIGAFCPSAGNEMSCSRREEGGDIFSKLRFGHRNPVCTRHTQTITESSLICTA